MRKTDEIYKSKLITLDEALSKVKSDMSVVISMVMSEATGFASNLHKVKDQVENVDVYMCLPMGDYDFYTKKEMEGHFRLISWFHNGGARAAEKAGLDTVTFLPNHLHRAGLDLLDFRTPDIFVGACTPPDHTGHVCLSGSLVYEKEMLENAKLVLLEVNENLPRCHGDTHVRVDAVDFFYENKAPIPALPEAMPSDTDMIIGNYIADLVEDGSTIQLGIGGIPNAAAMAFKGKKDLGVHTEMFVDTMVDLYYDGVINNSKKSIFKDKFICTFALGSKKLYDFINDNLAVEIHRGAWVNDPVWVAKNHKMVSINTCLMVDLTGQVASESLGPVQYSGTGGQFDTAMGAKEGIVGGKGKSIIACYSTARKGQITSIVPTLPQGSAVTLHRANTDYVITEHGVASLRGKDVRRRALELIEIAHPDFRPQLVEEAKKLKYI
jgi:acyl-CoA hydrolase